MNRPTLILVAVFLITRPMLIFSPPITSDVFIYARYAREIKESHREGVSFYAYHARQIEQQAEETRAAGRLVGSLDEYKTVEYPPLALLFMRLPTLFISADQSSEDYAASYLMVFRSLMAAVDVGMFGLLAWFLRQRECTPLFAPVLGGEGFIGSRLTLYFLATLLLWHLLYDRLDLLLALMILASLALLSSRLSYAWSFALLALAINFKLVPIVLAPVWAIGSLPEDCSLISLRSLRLVIVRSALLLSLVATIFLPFYIASGRPALDFLTYHQSRGIELGSVYGLPNVLKRLTGTPITVEYTYGSINIVSALATDLAKLAPLFTACALLGATILLIAHAHRVGQPRRVNGEPGRISAGSPPGAYATGLAQRATLAQRHSQLFAAFTLLFLMLFIATNKVFSPQYLLWLAPLLALALPKNARGQWLMAGFLLICSLSTLLVPFLFVLDLYNASSETVPRPVNPPTIRLCLILLARNMLYLGLVLGLLILITKARKNENTKKEGLCEGVIEKD
jgi:hypothetical protein